MSSSTQARRIHAIAETALFKSFQTAKSTLTRTFRHQSLVVLAAGVGALMCSCQAPAPQSVLTYHYDNGRTGWNPNETTLTTANVASTRFQLLRAVTVDDQIDAQPLVVANQVVDGDPNAGAHDVVYVATERNTIYAIDPTNGSVLKSRNLGPPVPRPAMTCTGPNIGIMGTPVIDGSGKTMYLVDYTFNRDQPTYMLHALDLATLNDKVPAVIVSGTHFLTNGQVIPFSAKFERQRPGLLLSNGNVYAAFGSHCDYFWSGSRGWLFGWKADTLNPLPSNHLTNRVPATAGGCGFPELPPPCFLTAVWMSGSGLAGDANGDIFFTTGNTDRSGTSNSAADRSESVVKVSGDLGTSPDYFTPFDVATLDQGDADLGSGGILLLPPQGGPVPDLATVAGKTGTMYLMDQHHLGGITAGGPDNVVATVDIGGCWCGESYFGEAGSDNRIVSSGGNQVTLWRLVLSPQIALMKIGSSAPILGVQDPGFFTTVSSAGAGPGVIIWAVSRADKAMNVWLYAFSESTYPNTNTLKQLFRGNAGEWPSPGNANIVPVVANGRVYVASYKLLSIYGLQ